jgi:hypothetical protein
MGNMHEIEQSKLPQPNADASLPPVIQVAPREVAEEKPTGEPTQEEIDQVISILEAGLELPLPSTPEKLTPRWDAYNRFIKTHSKKAMLFGGSFYLAALVLYLLRDVLSRELLLLILSIYGAAASTAMIAAMLSEALLVVPMMQRMRHKPFEFFTSQLRTSAACDFPTACALSKCHPQAVKFVHRQYLYHRTSLEKRGATLSGSIDKIGVFPALAALAVLWAALSNAPYGPWLVMLVPIILVFHLLNLYSIGLQLKLDRMLAVLEYVVAASAATKKA